MAAIRKTWPGPITTAGLPTGKMVDLRLSCKFDEEDSEAKVAQTLKPLLGQARVQHYALVKRGLVWNKSRWQVRGHVKNGRVHLRIPSLKQSQLTALVEHLAVLPNARALSLKAQQR